MGILIGIQHDVILKEKFAISTHILMLNIQTKN